jgi:hypothetical protein
MKKLLLLLLLVGFLVGCGDRVEVPPAHVGKILGKSGYMPDIIPPSKFRLDPCFAYCDKLVVAQASDAGLKESMTLFMPKDKLNIKVDIRGTMSVSKDKGTMNSLFDRMVASKSGTSEYDSVITANAVYLTYGQQAVRGVVRSELVKYGINEVMQNREAIGKSIHAAIVDKLKSTGTPINISRFELADVQPPQIIITAQEAAKKREIDIQRTEADAAIDIVQAEKDLEIAQKNRLVAKEKALSIAEQNKIAAKSITPQLLEYRRLEVQEKVMMEMAKNQNSMIVPLDMDTNSQMATFAKMMGKELKK